MRKVFGIVFYVLAGFFVYMVCLLAFVNQPAMAKWAIVAGFSMPAAVFLFIGLAVARFRRWKRDSGVVLLSGAGFTAFLVFTFVCLLMTDEFKKMMKPDTLDFFGAYASGFIFMLSVAGLGILLLTKGKHSAEQSHAEATSEAAPSAASEASDA